MPSSRWLIPRQLGPLVFRPVATPAGFGSLVLSFFAARSSTTTLTHSSNAWSHQDPLCSTDCSFKPWSAQRHSASRVVSCCLSGRTPHTSLAAGLPLSLLRKKRLFLWKSVTLASDDFAPLSRGNASTFAETDLRGRERQFLPTIQSGFRPTLSQSDSLIGFRVSRSPLPFCQRSYSRRNT